MCITVIYTTTPVTVYNYIILYIYMTRNDTQIFLLLMGPIVDIIDVRDNWHIV